MLVLFPSEFAEVRQDFVIFQIGINNRIPGGGDHSLEFLASHIWKDAFKNVRLRYFKMGWTIFTENP